AGTVNLLLYTGSAGGGGGGGGTPSVASFLYSCANNRTCSFNASGSTGATAYSWNFGDGSSGSGVSVLHQFRKNSTNIVTLTTTPAGTQSSTSKTVTCVKNTCS